MKYLKSLNEYFYEEIKDVPRINFERLLEIIGAEPPKKEFDEEDIIFLRKIGFNLKSNKEALGSYMDNLVTVYVENDTYNIKIISPTNEYKYTKKRTLREALNHLRGKLNLKIRKRPKPYEKPSDEFPPINLNILPVISYGYTTFDLLLKSEENNPKFSSEDIKKLKYIGFKVTKNRAIGKLSIKLFGKHGEKRTDKTIKDCIIEVDKTEKGYSLTDNESKQAFFNPHTSHITLNDVLFNIKYRFWSIWYTTGRIINDPSKLMNK